MGGQRFTLFPKGGGIGQRYGLDHFVFIFVVLIMDGQMFTLFQKGGGIGQRCGLGHSVFTLSGLDLYDKVFATVLNEKAAFAKDATKTIFDGPDLCLRNR